MVAEPDWIIFYYSGNADGYRANGSGTHYVKTATMFIHDEATVWKSINNSISINVN